MSLKTSQKSTSQKHTSAQNSSRPQNHILRFFTPPLLCIWSVFSLIASQYAVGFTLSLIIGKSILQPIWSAIYQILSYALTVFLCIFLPHILYKTHQKRHKSNPPASTPQISCEPSSSAPTPQISHTSTSQISCESLGLSGLPTFSDIGLAPVAYICYLVAAGLLTNLATKLLPWFDPNQAQDIGYNFLTSAPDRIAAFLAIVITAPIVEELIFRGWLYGKLRSKSRLIPAIILTSLTFAIAHGQWNVGLAVFILSIFLCLQREVTGTIYSGILTHMLVNGVSFFLLYILQ